MSSGAEKALIACSRPFVELLGPADKSHRGHAVAECLEAVFDRLFDIG